LRPGWPADYKLAFYDGFSSYIAGSFPAFSLAEFNMPARSLYVVKA
jgi:hypothetical protein